MHHYNGVKRRLSKDDNKKRHTTIQRFYLHKSFRVVSSTSIISRMAITPPGTLSFVHGNASKQWIMFMHNGNTMKFAVSIIIMV